MQKKCSSCGRCVEAESFQCPACRSSAFNGANPRREYLAAERLKRKAQQITELNEMVNHFETYPTQWSWPCAVVVLVLFMGSALVPIRWLQVCFLVVGGIMLFAARILTFMSYQGSFLKTKLMNSKRKKSEPASSNPSFHRTASGGR